MNCTVNLWFRTWGELFLVEWLQGIGSWLKLFSVSLSEAIQFTVQLELIMNSKQKVLRLSIRVILSISKSQIVLKTEPQRCLRIPGSFSLLVCLAGTSLDKI